jgi:Astacin (Peptidase family M12A)
VSERIAQAVWFAILVCFLAAEFSRAQQITDKDKESDFCGHQTKYRYYDVNGSPHYVPYSVIDGQDVVEGDIVIGDAEGSSYFPPAVPRFVNRQATRWEGNEVPYVIDSSIDKNDSSKDKLYAAAIRDAIKAWQDKTNITFKELSGPRDWRKENYVKFVFGPAPAEKKDRLCSSNSFGVKAKVGEPNDDEHKINVVKVGGCTPYLGEGDPSWGRVAHEIGHVLGLGHEQSRQDRDQNIKVLWGNLEDKTQFCPGIFETRPHTAYDYDSIMHYSPLQDVKPSGCQKVMYGETEQCVAFVPLDKDWLGWPPSIGQRKHLSKSDIEAVNTLYPPLKKPEPPPGPQPSTPPCVIVTKTTIKVGDGTKETTKTELCTPGAGPIPGDQQCCQERGCCQEKIVVAPSCHHDRCRPPVKVNWPRPDRWCRSEWCRPRPRPRPLCDRDGWSEDRPPFDDWDDRS